MIDSSICPRLRADARIISYDMPAITGINAMRVTKFSTSESNFTTENETIATSITTIKKLVPQRGCCRRLRRAFSTVSGSPASQVYTTLCSAPWYWNTRRISFSSDIVHIMIMKKDILITPSTRLNPTEGLTGLSAARSQAHASAYHAPLDECAKLDPLPK